MKLLITNSDFESVRSEIAKKQARLNDLGVKLGDAMSRSGSFPAGSPEYAAVHLEMQNLQQTIDGLINVLSKYDVQSESEISADIVGTYSVVTLLCKEKEPVEYYFLPAGVEKDVTEGYLIASPESPVGQALIGRKEGETVDIKLPSGDKTYKIVKLDQKF